MKREMRLWPSDSETPLAILASGGVDSSILLALAAKSHTQVHPIFVRSGTRWEEIEKDHLQRFIQRLDCNNIKPIVELTQPVEDLYGFHWSLTGEKVPSYDSADEAVYLPGRNLILFLKPMLWCVLNQIPVIASAPLISNPFPDATPRFYQQLSEIICQATRRQVQVVTPFIEHQLHKDDVLLLGSEFPLELTFSCIDPREGKHCGQCNKCAERIASFAQAGLLDPTEYYS